MSQIAERSPIAVLEALQDLTIYQPPQTVTFPVLQRYRRLDSKVVARLHEYSLTSAVLLDAEVHKRLLAEQRLYTPRVVKVEGFSTAPYNLVDGALSMLGAGRSRKHGQPVLQLKIEPREYSLPSFGVVSCWVKGPDAEPAWGLPNPIVAATGDELIVAAGGSLSELAGPQTEQRVRLVLDTALMVGTVVLRP